MSSLENGAVDFGTFALLPAARLFKGAGLLPKIGNTVFTGGYQGEVIGGIDSLANKGDYQVQQRGQPSAVRWAVLFL